MTTPEITATPAMNVVCHECGHQWPYDGKDDRCPACRGKDTQVVDTETGRPVN